MTRIFAFCLTAVLACGLGLAAHEGGHGNHKCGGDCKCKKSRDNNASKPDAKQAPSESKK